MDPGTIRSDRSTTRKMSDFTNTTGATDLKVLTQQFESVTYRHALLDYTDSDQSAYDETPTNQTPPGETNGHAEWLSAEQRTRFDIDIYVNKLYDQVIEQLIDLMRSVQFTHAHSVPGNIIRNYLKSFNNEPNCTKVSNPYTTSLLTRMYNIYEYSQQHVPAPTRLPQQEPSTGTPPRLPQQEPAARTPPRLPQQELAKRTPPRLPQHEPAQQPGHVTDNRDEPLDMRKLATIHSDAEHHSRPSPHSQPSIRRRPSPEELVPNTKMFELFNRKKLDDATLILIERFRDQTITSELAEILMRYFLETFRALNRTEWTENMLMRRIHEACVILEKEATVRGKTTEGISMMNVAIKVAQYLSILDVESSETTAAPNLQTPRSEITSAPNLQTPHSETTTAPSLQTPRSKYNVNPNEQQLAELDPPHNAIAQQHNTPQCGTKQYYAQQCSNQKMLP
ncbi:uncharacterized protein LOC141914671 [Tubulanus polymorphus]|uniref:uncharacterized protein LOC141914671 n=1 Tax=Tubulanus polymorphus TaxID=672921 RepID=UPI003DA1D9CC